MKTITINNQEYEIIPPHISQATNILVKMWERLGKPDTPFTENGAKLLDIIIAIWEDLEPLEAQRWYEERKQYQKEELSISEQVRHHTGRSLASYPYLIYQLMRKVFKDFKPADRENCIKLVKRWPMFRYCNKV